MRRAILLIVYAVLFMVIGRNLSFLPAFKQPPKAAPPDKLKKAVLSASTNRIAVINMYYKDLVTGSSFGINEQKVLTGASVNKIYIAEYLYYLAAQNRINLEDTIQVQKEDIQDYGTGSLRYQEPGRSYSLKTLAELMLRESDNTAAHILGIRLGMTNIQRYIGSIGLHATDMENNKTTAADAGRALELLYTNKITSPALTKEVLGYMKDTEFEDRLSRELPAGVVAYHKIGDGVRLVHDAAILENSKAGDIRIVVVLTSDVSSEEQAKELIGRIGTKLAQDMAD